MKHEDLTGQQFGRWTAVRYAGKSKWECRCECGWISCVEASKLKSGKSKCCIKCRAARAISDEVKAKISESAKGRAVSTETRKRMSESAKSRASVSEETRKKMSESAKKRGMPEAVRLKGIQKKNESVEGGRTEHNRNAKQWHLISPSGEEYIISNLMLFIRNHASLFGIDGTDEETHYIIRRFSTLKHHMKGDKKQQTCCSGWSLIIPEDDRINKYKK